MYKHKFIYFYCCCSLFEKINIIIEIRKSKCKTKSKKKNAKKLLFFFVLKIKKKLNVVVIIIVVILVGLDVDDNTFRFGRTFGQQQRRRVTATAAASLMILMTLLLLLIQSLFWLVVLEQIGNNLGDDQVLWVAREKSQRQDDIFAEIRVDEFLKERSVLRGRVRDVVDDAQAFAYVRVAIVAVDDQRVDPGEQVEHIEDAHQAQPEPQEYEDLLVEEVYRQHTLNLN